MAILVERAADIVSLRPMQGRTNPERLSRLALCSLVPSFVSEIQPSHALKRKDARSASSSDYMQVNYTIIILNIFR